MTSGTFIMAGGSPRTEWLERSREHNKGLVLTGRDLDPVIQKYYWPLERVLLMLDELAWSV